ncbi:Ni/Fe-hydrogenase, b-type cytochrome subunit [Azovibrio restrictus]|uniref:Ni/Fe-hydrogenase, b-type cytochrome subunit n=1 Tax=Azovibrio restrictus TaxID=146938 RepID=UPI0026F00C26|nr:Ni/Fe-hydrogenase, b-type cytochrome subunit [Azovibrio restrictus]
MLSQQDMLEAERHGRQVRSIYVYEAPVRLWHWINAAAMVVLAVTGYFIGLPPPSVPGEAVDNFLLGYIRFAHFAAGYVFAIGLLARVYWACVGNHHARQIFMLPVTNRAWWSEVLFELRWYLFLEKHPKKYVGHNPMAQLMMFFFFTLLAFGMVITGFALYSEGAGQGSWSDTLFGWVLPLLGGSMQTHSWHRLGMWIMMSFVLVHVYAAIREDIMSRQSLISTMVSGWRMFKD